MNCAPGAPKVSSDSGVGRMGEGKKSLNQSKRSSLDRPAFDIMNFLGAESLPGSSESESDHSDLVNASIVETQMIVPSQQTRDGRRFNRNSSLKQLTDNNECSFLDNSIVESVNSIVALQEQQQRQKQQEDELNLSVQSNNNDLPLM